MSINALTDDELRRSATPANPTPEDKERAKATQDNPASNRASMLIKYIPTESVTLYVAAVAATPALQSMWPKDNKTWYVTLFYWIFASLTPVIVFLLYTAKRKYTNTTPTIPSLPQWPWWKIIASTIAFLAWTLAVPNGPFLQGDKIEIKGAIAAFLAVFVSVIFSLLEPLIQGSDS